MNNKKIEIKMTIEEMCDEFNWNHNTNISKERFKALLIMKPHTKNVYIPYSEEQIHFYEFVGKNI